MAERQSPQWRSSFAPPHTTGERRASKPPQALPTASIPQRPTSPLRHDANPAAPDVVFHCPYATPPGGSSVPPPAVEASAQVAAHSSATLAERDSRPSAE